MDYELTNQQVSDFLRKQILIKGITDEEISYLVDMAEQVVLGPNEIVFPEGDNSTDLYFICKGEVSIIKMDQKTGQEHTLNTLREGDFFGDLAFLDGEPRSSTVKADCETHLLKISKESSYAQSTEMVSIYNKIMSNIAKINIKRIRETNQSYVEEMGAEVTQLQRLISHGKLFIIATFLLWGIGILSAEIQDAFLQNIVQLTIVSLLLIFIINQFFPPLSDYGLTFKNWKNNIKLSLSISLGLVATIAALYIVGKLLRPIYPSIRLFNFTPLNWNWELAIFPLCIYLKEFILRGVIQTSLNDFLQESNGKRSILYTAALIAFLSLPLGIKWTLLIFPINYALGSIYYRYPQLLGVALIHAIICILLVLLSWMPQSWLLLI